MDKIVIDNKIWRFETEFQHTDDITRRSQLKAIVSKLKNSNQNPIEKFNQILNNIEIQQTKKPYHRLNVYQKEQLVKAYVEKTWGENDKYTKQIMELIKDKKIVTANVVYDMDKFVLDNIKNIIVQDDNIVIKPKKKAKD